MRGQGHIGAMVFRIRHLLAVAALATLGLTVRAEAEDARPPASAPVAASVLVELFTSQGCNSCPPADEMIAELAARPNVVALSLHVDYWDYLGWRDTFASRAHTQRQYAYREAFGARVVYTPQMIVQGAADAIGSRRGEVDRLIEQAEVQAGAATIAILDKPDGPVARVSLGTGPISGRCDIFVAEYDRKQVVDIARGENRGRRLTYTNVVRSLARTALWDGKGPVEVMLPRPREGSGLAVWVQAPGMGPILGAAKLEP